MTTFELDSKVKDLRELKRLVADAESLIDSLQDDIKAEMTAQGVDTLTGADWKATFKSVTQTRIDTTAFKKALPELAEKFSKKSTYKRFVLA